MVRHIVLTLTGSAQKLVTSADPNLVGTPGLLQLWLQPGAANANPIYVGGPDVTASDYGVRLEAAAGGIPPAPFSIGELDHPKYVTLGDVYVIGTAAEKLHILYVPYQ